MHKVIIFWKIPSGSLSQKRINEPSKRRKWLLNQRLFQKLIIIRIRIVISKKRWEKKKHFLMHYLRTWTEISLPIFLSRFWTIFSPTPGLLKMLKVIWNLSTNSKQLSNLLRLSDNISLPRSSFNFTYLIWQFINKPKVNFASVCVCLFSRNLE